MNWQGWTALGVLGAAIAVPLIRKRMGNRSDFQARSTFNAGASENLGTMGGRSAPASDTWSQGGGTP